MEFLVFLLDKLAGAIVALPVVMLFLFIFDRKRLVEKWIWVVLFVVYMNAMLVMIGAPNYAYFVYKPTVNLIPFRDFSLDNIKGMILNIIMFVPFGFFLPVYFKQFRSLASTVLAGAVMSVLIEILQLFTFRVTDVDDLLMNTIGAFLGYVIAAFLIQKTGKKTEKDRDIIKLTVIVVVHILVCVFVNYQIMEVILCALGMLE